MEELNGAMNQAMTRGIGKKDGHNARRPIGDWIPFFSNGIIKGQ